MTKDDFSEILTQYPEAVSDRQRLSNLLNDYFPQEPKMRRILVFLQELGITDEIEDTEAITKQFAYRLFRRLVDEYDVSNENAYFGVYLWCSCYGEGILGKTCGLIESYADSFGTQANKAEETADNEAYTDDDDINPGAPRTSREYEDYYVNVSFIRRRGRIYIPCSFSESDFGYYICGIVERAHCIHPHADLYALVYNYVIRNSLMTPDDKPIYLKNREFPYELKYENVFRLITIILQLIKNNYIKDTSIGVSFDGYINELKCAIDVINDYAFLFGRLMGISPCPILKHITGKTSINITLSGTQGVYIKNSESVYNAREIWYGRKIQYNLGEANLQDLEYLLEEISPYREFLPGQFEALCALLACNGNYLCTMPAGAGKSVVYYLASLLQPLPVFIVVPRDDLIFDKITDLRETHRIDNVTHLSLTSPGVFQDFEICNNLIFLTSVTFQNKGLLERFKLINDEMQISYIILDGAHCLSDRDSDFRPEWLMLCAKLTLLQERVTFLAFTSTENVNVISDIKRYLGVSQKNTFVLPGSASENTPDASADSAATVTRENFVHGIIKYQGELSHDEKAAFVDTYPAGKLPLIKRYLYVLFVIGFIEDWYILSADEHGDAVNIMITVSTSEDYRFVKRGSVKMLEHVRQKTLDYLNFIGNCRDESVKIKLAGSVEAIINTFADWYYTQFLA